MGTVAGMLSVLQSGVSVYAMDMVEVVCAIGIYRRIHYSVLSFPAREVEDGLRVR